MELYNKESNFQDWSANIKLQGKLTGFKNGSFTS